METACTQIAAWAGRKEGAHLSIAVNVSAREFRQPKFVDHVLLPWSEPAPILTI